MTQPALQPNFAPQFDSAALPNDYGDVRAEYEALRHGVALFDLSPTGKLTIGGKNAVQFINGLVSNDVKTLPLGAGVLATFPNVQGKVAALARIYQTADGLLLELDTSNREKIFKNLNRFVLAGEFFLTDATEQLALLSLQGPRAAELLNTLTGADFSTTPAIYGPYTIAAHTIADTPVQIATHSRSGEIGFDLYLATDSAAQVWQTLLAHGARSAGQAALETARLEAAIPREPVDVNEQYIVNETNLTDAVSYTKGCYLGQEIIARIHWRGQPAKQLKGLWLEAAEPPAKGTELWAADGKKVGEITSSVRSLALERLIAFGYVHRNYLTAGTQFTLKTGEAEVGQAALAETPFVTQA
jgi:folate-binding protein YgfZ